jgi:hypothetical protein
MRKSYRTISLVILCVVIGVGLANIVSSPAAVAQQGGPAERQLFQVSAFGGGEKHDVPFGAYVINTTSGKVWLIREGGEATPVSGTLLGR